MYFNFQSSAWQPADLLPGLLASVGGSPAPSLPALLLRLMEKLFVALVSDPLLYRGRVWQEVYLGKFIDASRRVGQSTVLCLALLTGFCSRLRKQPFRYRNNDVAGASCLEGVTAQLDNAFVPLHFYVLATVGWKV